MGSYFLGVFLFAVGIAVTIALHEFGHFSTARIFGMRVRRFFVGFGPTVISFTRGKTQYGFKAVPLGGFCDIAGMTNQDEVTPEEAPVAMRNKPAWQRIIVLLGGIIMNLIVAFVVLYGVAITSGLPNTDVDTTPKVGELSCVPLRQIDAQTLAECSGKGPADKAGLKVGDTISRVDDNQLVSFVELRDYVITRPGQTVTLHVDRDGKELAIPVEVASATRLDAKGNEVEIGAIGVSNAPVENPVIAYNPVSALGGTFNYTGEVIKASAEGLVAFPAKIPGVMASIFGAERDINGPMSVVGVSRVGGELVERDMWSSFFMMLASLNVFLALFNLIPLPPLDGGHIAVVLYEKARDFFRKLRGLQPGGPADYTKLMPITLGVASILLAVGLLVIIADVVNPIRLFG